MTLLIFDQFHRGTYTVRDVKDELANNGLIVRTEVPERPQ